MNYTILPLLLFFPSYTHISVPCQPFHKQIKYGVIQQDKLCKDLTQWETFYVSGRMQKPVRI